jgi:hypothetical protein
MLLPASTSSNGSRQTPKSLPCRPAARLKGSGDRLIALVLFARLPLAAAVAGEGTHINRIFAKTGARDSAQAVRYAYQTGLASPAT